MLMMLFPESKFLPILCRTSLRTLLCILIFYLFVLTSSPVLLMIHSLPNSKCPAGYFISSGTPLGFGYI